MIKFDNVIIFSKEWTLWIQNLAQLLYIILHSTSWVAYIFNLEFMLVVLIYGMRTFWEVHLLQSIVWRPNKRFALLILRYYFSTVYQYYYD